MGYHNFILEGNVKKNIVFYVWDVLVKILRRVINMAISSQKCFFLYIYMHLLCNIATSAVVAGCLCSLPSEPGFKFPWNNTSVPCIRMYTFPSTEKIGFDFPAVPLAKHSGI